MSPGNILLLAAVAALVVAAVRWGFGSRDMPRALRPLVDTGTVFILAGMLIGPQGLNLFTERILVELDPVIIIGLGWIGFLYGSHLEWRLLRRYPRRLYAAGFLESALTFAVVAGAAWLLLSMGPGAGPGAARERVAAALILGICAAGTAPAGVFHLSSRGRLGREDLNALQFISAVDDLPPLVLLGVVGAVMHPALDTGARLPPVAWLGLSVGLGLALGVITHWLFRRGDVLRENTLILLGSVALGAGAATLLQVSPLVVMVLAGATFANLSTRKETAYGLLAEREHELYAVFLLVAGILFPFAWAQVLLLAPAYLALRAAGKLAGGWLGWRLFLRRTRVSPGLGTGLLFQGGMALAMLVSFVRTRDSALNEQVLTIVVVAVVVNELLGPAVAARALGRRGSPGEAP